MRRLLPLFLLATAVAASCGAPRYRDETPCTARIGGLTIENRTLEPVAVAGRWVDEEGMHVSVEALIPGIGHSSHHQFDDPLPPGRRLAFAARGDGFEALLDRTGLRGEGNAVLSFTRSIAPSEEGTLPGAQASWTTRDGGLLLVVEEDGAGGLRLSEHAPRR